MSAAEWTAAMVHDKRLQRIAQQTRVTPVGESFGPIIATPAQIARAGGRELAQYEAGRTAVAQSGCLACHRIGEHGNAGPGPDLTEVADRLPEPAIERALVNPTEPMPSFKNLPPQKFRAMVAFLAELK